MAQVDLNIEEWKHNIFVDVDSLFDTRLALAYHLDPNNILNLIKGDPRIDKYRNRVMDNYGNISNDIFMSIYERRSKKLFKLALLTYIPWLIREQYAEYSMDVKTLSDGNDAKLIVNIYPYDFTTNEQHNLIEPLSNMLGNIDIEFVYLKYKEISPKFLLEHKVSIVILYEMYRWLETVTTEYNILKEPIANIYCIGPAIFTGGLSTDMPTKEDFEKHMEMMKCITNLSLIDVKYFSAMDLINDNDVNNYEKE